MVQSSESAPGQVAAAIKNATFIPRGGTVPAGGTIPPELLGIKHGHEDGEPTAETPEKPPWPDHLIPRAETPEG